MRERVLVVLPMLGGLATVLLFLKTATGTSSEFLVFRGFSRRMSSSRLRALPLGDGSLTALREEDSFGDCTGVLICGREKLRSIPDAMFQTVILTE